MTLADVVLFLHISTVLAAIALAAVLHTSEWLMTGAGTVGQLRVVSRPQRYGFLFGPIIIVLFLTGAWELHLSDGEFSFSDGWVQAAIVALIILFVVGPTIMGRHATALLKAVAEAPEGPVTPELRAMVDAPLPWVIGYFSTFLALGVVFNMVTKPSLLGSLVVLLIATAIGAGLGRFGAQRAAKLPA